MSVETIPSVLFPALKRMEHKIRHTRCFCIIISPLFWQTIMYQSLQLLGVRYLWNRNGSHELEYSRVTLLDPTVAYFSPSEHLPFAILGVIFFSYIHDSAKFNINIGPLSNQSILNQSIVQAEWEESGCPTNLCGEVPLLLQRWSP